MELAAPLILIASVVGIGAYLGLELALRARLRKRTVIVVLKGDGAGSFRGVLWHQTPRHVELRGAEFLDGEGRVPSDGSIVLPRSNIAWIQRPEEL